MLNSDRIYLAKFALDPETENPFDDLDLYSDDEIEELAGNKALDPLFENQDSEFYFENQDDMEERSNED